MLFNLNQLHPKSCVHGSLFRSTPNCICWRLTVHNRHALPDSFASSRSGVRCDSRSCWLSVSALRVDQLRCPARLGLGQPLQCYHRPLRRTICIDSHPSVQMLGMQAQTMTRRGAPPENVLYTDAQNPALTQHVHRPAASQPASIATTTTRQTEQTRARSGRNHDETCTRPSRQQQ